MLGNDAQATRMIISMLVDEVSNPAEFAAIIGTVIKKWTDDRGINTVRFTENLLNSIHFAEIMLEDEDGE